MAKTMGYGLMDAGYQQALSTSPGYNKDYKGRSYDPAKAKQLLAKAGYPNGFKTKIIITGAPLYRDVATALQGYLAAVGIDAQMDVADIARYNSLIFQTTWKDSLFLYTSGQDPGVVFADRFIKVYKPGGRFPSMARPPELAGLMEQCFSATDTATLFSLSRQMVKWVADEALTIPIVTLPFPVVSQEYVHISYHHGPTPGVWDMSSDWMEKK